jgi:hypothetical protein
MPSVLNKGLKSELVRRRERFSHIALCYRIVWVREQGDRRLAQHSLRFSSIEPAQCSWQPIHTTRHERITAFALHKQFPSTFADQLWAERDRCISTSRIYVGRILKGLKNGDLPIVQAQVRTRHQPDDRQQIG